MPVKTLHLPDGRTFRFGRKRPVVRHPKLSFKNYMLPGIPAPPPTADYTPAATAALQEMVRTTRLATA
jgi:hypothetical protein